GAETVVTVAAREARIGFLAACDNHGGGAARRQPGVALLHPKSLIAATRAAAARHDYLVVSLHTGVEFSIYPEPFLQDLARALIRSGATVVAGHHPHVVQGLERFESGLIA